MRGYILAVGAAAFISLFYLLIDPSSEIMPFFSNLSVTALSLIAALSAAVNLRRYGLRGKIPRCFILILAASVLWFLGEAIWSFYALVLGEAFPYPSLADLFWVAGFPVMAGGLAYYLRAFEASFDRVRFGAGLAVSTALVLIIIATLIAPVMEPSSDPLARAFDLLYPLLDAAIIFIIIVAVFTFRGGRIGRAWYLLAASLFMDAAADVMFGHAAATGAYYEGHPLDLLYDYGYILFTLAMYEHQRAL
ncbi:MAG: hypothetical protein QW390_01220 [Candidatus Bathyarchaeia archaeon]